MKFEATKCDGCDRIQGEVNHWVPIHVILTGNEEVVGVVLGPIGENIIPTSSFCGCHVESHDLCGQGCAMKHIAKLLGWNTATEAAGEAREGAER